MVVKREPAQCSSHLRGSVPPGVITTTRRGEHDHSDAGY
jgi:hypothetical protein